MVNKKIDRVENSMEKKSLLNKYDIPVDHLSYEYITQCENAKELERIITILRSGEEGYYPDLNKHAESRLATMKPSSTVLRVAEPVLKKDMLEPENREMLEKDISEWMSEMKMREKDLEEGRRMNTNEPIPQPAVRKIMFDQPEKNQQQSQQKTQKRIASCDYAGWDKYDAETEINRIDLQHDVKQAEAKKAQKILSNKGKKMKNESREEIVNRLALTGTELSMMAERDREKGNEAFKAGDYEEALHFYESSVAIDPTINAYNNRAITFIKLQRYKDALNDCNKVLSVDHTNVKALLRRGLALEHLEKRTQALADYEAVLKLEPANKIAIGAVSKLRGPCNSKKIRMKIEDGAPTDENSSKQSIKSSGKVDTLSEEEMKVSSGGKTSNLSAEGHPGLAELKTNVNNAGPNRTQGRALAAPNSQMRSQICFCNNAPSSSRRSTPQPHFRDVYCPKAFQKPSGNSPKSQSIFTDAKASYGKNSSVIIEEIPNEPCEKSENKINQREKKKISAKGSNNFGNFGGGDHDVSTKKSDVVTQPASQRIDVSKADKNIRKKNEKNCPKAMEGCDNLTNPRRSFAKTCDAAIEEIPNVEFAKTRDDSKTENGRKILTETETISKNFQPVKDRDRNGKKDDSKRELSLETCGKKCVENGGGGFDESSKSSTIRSNSVGADTKIPSKISSSLNSGDTLPTANEKINEKLNSDEKNAEPKVLKTIGKTVTFATNHGKKEGNKEFEVTDDSISKDESAALEETENIEFGKIESPYEFLRLWYSIRNDPHLIHRANLLKAFPPEKIEAVIGNKLDGDMLSLILTCFEHHYCSVENLELLSRFLQHLGQVKRFSIVRMFMDEKDKTALRNIFSFLERQKSTDLTRELRKTFDVPM
ncbi:uncharacterized protein Spag1 [Venturia canescens]|uniref:uncharacterized protein Spag1 n=1 Tax=Venturia canescens TaxID=32260 RepID=UPI001C9D3579|nr:uncharacterized protein LOC122410893 [Venturia canescens]